MNEITATDITADILPSDDEPSGYLAKRAVKSAGTTFPPDEDIELWLKYNAPATFRQLADIRYCLYHHCSRADFTVTNVLNDKFDLSGRHSKLRIINDDARHCLLWKLRMLGKENSWIGALPRTRKPRAQGSGY